MVSLKTLEETIATFPPVWKIRERNNKDLTAVREILKTCPQGKTLPNEFIPSDLEPNPPQLWYGFGINIEDMLKYYRQKLTEFPNLPDIDPAGLTRMVMQQVESRLYKLCGYTIEFKLVLSDKYDMVLEWYDSYNFKDTQFKNEDEKDMINDLKLEVPWQRQVRVQLDAPLH
ncbi:hypothetical protein C8R42DRAFT_724348 [Lentinula raphanica]|nr:hypothetical protein C8R42DRAFT_724348 [Lentinula raphanica]